MRYAYDVSDNSEVVRSLHCTADGRWLIVEGQVGTICPPIPGYEYVGSPSDAFSRLNFHVKQSTLATMCGVTQQSVSRYAMGSSEPYPGVWSRITRLLFEQCLNLPEHEHTADLYRANVLAPAHRR